MRVYLAGPMTHNPDGKKWRRQVKHSSTTVDWLDPVAEAKEDEEDLEPETIVELDRGMLRDADAVLVGDTGERSPGTWREVEYALSICEIPVVILLDPLNAGNLDKLHQPSPWLRQAGHCSMFLEDAIYQIRQEVSE
ncbi:MAG: nucleoside 2-deoxyribosyltransferase [Halobacteria archaeon]